MGQGTPAREFEVLTLRSTLVLLSIAYYTHIEQDLSPWPAVNIFRVVQCNRGSVPLLLPVSDLVCDVTSHDLLQLVFVHPHGAHCLPQHWMTTYCDNIDIVNTDKLTSTDCHHGVQDSRDVCHC